MQEGQPILSVEGLTFAFGNQRALHEVDLKLAAGERFILLGPNGCGKTTLLKCILGMLRPQSGRIRLFGQDVNAVKNLGIATNLKDALLLSSSLTVREFIDYHMRLKGVKTSTASELIDELVLGEIMNKRVTRLSSGQEKLVYDIVAVAGGSRFVVLDEPFAEVDPKRRVTLVNAITSMTEGFMMTTHDLFAIELIPNASLSVMLNGRVYGSVSPAAKIFPSFITKQEDISREGALLTIGEGKSRLSLVTKPTEDSVPLRRLEDLVALYEES